MSRETIRWIATIIFTVLFLPFSAANIQKYLAAKHWDEFLLNLKIAMPDLNYIAQSSWVWAALFFSGGVATALWVVRLWPEKGRKDSILEIIKAEYWTPNKRKNVKEILINMISDLISNNKLEFIVSNEILGGDPDIGTKKTLSIEYKFNRKTIKKDFSERENVIMP